jgi:hypothetical protein
MIVVNAPWFLAIECRGQAIASGVSSFGPSRIELYGGYAYFHPLSGSIATVPYNTISEGAVVGVNAYLNPHLGVQVESELSGQGPNDGLYSVEAGPVVRFSYGRLVPFVHVLGGVAGLSGPSLQPGTFGWGVTGGGGVDYALPYFHHLVALRPIQADFELTHVNFGTLAPNGLTGGLGEVKAFRIASGIVVRLGGDNHRARPLLYACEATPSSVFSGEPVTVTGSFVGPEVHGPSSYTWASNGGSITGTNETANISTAGLAPGSYTVSGHISQGKRAAANASCTAVFTVQMPAPPTIACSADPVAVVAGDSATITATAQSPDHRALSFSYVASAGEIASNVVTATLDTTGAPPGPISVECRVNDDLGQTASASAVVNVSASLLPTAQSRALCTLRFDRDEKRPFRVDNEATACLDEVALALEHDPTSRLTLTGERVAGETISYAVARAVNARSYLTQEKGINPARIDIKTGKTATRTVEIELVPMGTPVRYSDAFGTSPTAAPVSRVPVAPVSVPATPSSTTAPASPARPVNPPAPGERFRVQMQPSQPGDHPPAERVPSPKPKEQKPPENPAPKPPENPTPKPPA